VIRLRCREQQHEAVVRESSQGLEVVVDGLVSRPDVEEIAPGSFVLREGTRVEGFHVARDGDAIHLFWRGAVYRLDEEREGQRGPAARHAEGGLEAPMPGKVIKVAVAPGDRVEKGAEVLVVEAMKMENALRAPKAGVVRSVAVKVGDMVAPGRVLVEIE
jgi:3-methylcrotonyl-CoA carboxylase alpha subunit